MATVAGQLSANLLECLCVSLAALSRPPRHVSTTGAEKRREEEGERRTGLYNLTASSLSATENASRHLKISADYGSN